MVAQQGFLALARRRLSESWVALMLSNVSAAGLHCTVCKHTLPSGMQARAASGFAGTRCIWACKHAQGQGLGYTCVAAVEREGCDWLLARAAFGHACSRCLRVC